jgi:hypothetical protein
VGARFSAPVQNGPEAHPASCTMGTVSISRVKRPGRGLDHPPQFSAVVKERVEVYLYSPSEPSWPVLGGTSLYFTFTFTFIAGDSLYFYPVSCYIFIKKINLSLTFLQLNISHCSADSPKSVHCTTELLIPGQHRNCVANRRCEFKSGSHSNSCEHTA